MPLLRPTRVVGVFLLAGAAWIPLSDRFVEFFLDDMTALPARLCILDDEAAIRRQLVNFLEDFDEFSLLVAESAEQALKLLERTPADLAVVDIRLPGVHGLEFIAQAAARGLCRHFLLHTGSLNMALTPELAALGLTPEDIFHKPADLIAMLARIRALLFGP